MTYEDNGLGGIEGLDLEGFGRLYAALVDNAPDTAARIGLDATFSADALVRELISSDDPAEALRGFAARVESAGDHACALARRLAERLGDAGLGEKEPALPPLTAVRVATSGLLYLRCGEERIPYLSKLRVLGIEAAVNAALLCSALLPQASLADAEEVVKAEQRVCRSVVARASRPLAEAGDGPARGEWEDRRAIAAAIECLPLPYRLSASFRLNAAEGIAALEIDVTPPSLFPARCYVDGIGVVPASASMRRRAATDYNLRVLILLAAYTLRCCEDIEHVYVAGVEDTATRHTCYCSAVVAREDIEGIDLTRIEPVSFMRFIGAHIDEEDGELGHVWQDFSLGERRFCPPGRFDVVELSDRAVASDRSRRFLGAERVRDLSANESAAREEAARLVVSGLGESTEENVRMLLALGDEIGSEDVKSAVRGVAAALIAGSLDERDPEAVGEAVARFGGLSAAVDKAQELIGKGDPRECSRVLEDALAPMRAQGAYRDGNGVVWRSFGSYTERALFNRTLWDRASEVKLVPGSYINALSLLSMCHIVLGNDGAGLEASREAARIAPMSAEVCLSLVNCLENAGMRDEAFEQCCRTLSLSMDPEAIGLTYVTLAGIEYRGEHMRSSQACYQMAKRFVPGQLVDGLQKVTQLLGATPGEALSEEHVAEALRERGIAIAPVDGTLEALREIAIAAVDEGIFPLARCAFPRLVSLTRDDIDNGVLRSLEAEPDC